MAQCLFQKPKQYLHLNLVSTAYTSVFWSSCTLLPRGCMCMHRCKWIEFWTHNDKPHPSQQVNSNCIVRTKSLLELTRVMVMFLFRLNVDTIRLSKWVWQRTVYLTFVACSAWSMSKRCFAPRRSEYISLTAMLEHMTLLFWPILSIQRVHLLCPPGNNTEYIRKMIISKKKKINLVV